ncbi:MAG: hypothetical protein RJA70_4549, partial [Pseudomonadota bacterium]
MAAAEPLIAIVGPTASGKSALALDLALRCDGEIISADSVQIYRHFDIGSGKPTPDELRQVPHHLIGCAAPHEEMDASLFAERAEACIQEIRQRGRTPIICGGTFLWVRALVFGLAEAPKKSDQIRRAHAEFAEREGRAALHARLSAIDPASFTRLDPNDFVRVSRALEVFELTGKSLTSFHDAHGFREPRYDVRYAGIQHTPDALTARIRRRVEGMVEQGWAHEVEQLVAMGFRDTRPMASVGYRQVLGYCDSRAVSSSARNEEQLIEDITRVTKIFARRQRTW